MTDVEWIKGKDKIKNFNFAEEDGVISTETMIGTETGAIIGGTARTMNWQEGSAI